MSGNREAWLERFLMLAIAAIYVAMVVSFGRGIARRAKTEMQSQQSRKRPDTRATITALRRLVR